MCSLSTLNSLEVYLGRIFLRLSIWEKVAYWSILFIQFLNQQISLLLSFCLSGTEFYIPAYMYTRKTSILLFCQLMGLHKRIGLPQSYNTLPHDLLDLFCCPSENWLAQIFKLSCALMRADECICILLRPFHLFSEGF